MLTDQRPRGAWAKIEANSDSLVLLVIGLWLLAGLGYSLSLTNTLRFPDEQEYLILAENLRQEGHYSLDGVTPTAKRPAGYPLFLWILSQGGAGLVGFRVANFLLGALSLGIIYQLLARREGKLAGLLAVIIGALYPLYFFTAGTILSQTLGLALFITVIFLITREKSSLTACGAGGMLYGCLSLTVPLFLLNLPVVALGPRWLQREQWLKKTVVFVAAAGLVLGIWTWRNYAVFRTFVPVTTNSGLNLLLGNHPLARPNAYREAYQSIGEEHGEKLAGLTELERDRFFRNKALEWIKNHKTEALQLYLWKVIYYFSYSDILITDKETSRGREILLLLSYGPLLLILILRILLIRHYQPDRLEQYLLAVYLSNAFLLAVFHCRIRWRLPYDLLLIAVAAIFLVRLIQGTGAPASRQGRNGITGCQK